MTSAVIFDMDGLLLDSEQMYLDAFNEVLAPYGHSLDHETQARHIKGKRYTEGMQETLRIFHLEDEMTVDQMMAKFGDACKHRYGTIPVLPGAAKLVHHLYKHSVPMGVATSSGDSSFAQKTSRHNLLFDMFHHITKGTDPGIERSKPFPDIYLKCASLFEPKVEPQHCLAFEDAPVGAEASLAAGMTTILVPDPKLPKDLRGRAHFELNSLHDFEPQKFGLPAFNYQKVSHVIFDLDGLLLDTSHLYDEVNARLLAKHGKQVDHDFHLEIRGMRGQDIIPRMISHYGLPYDVPSFESEVLPQYRALMPSVGLKEGVARLVDHLSRHKIAMAVATSTSEAHFAAKTLNHKHVFDKFQFAIKAEDVDRGKPLPDVFLKCAAKFEIEPRNCLVFEDAPNGVEAATNAGMQTVMIPDQSALELGPKSTIKATQLLHSIMDFRPEDFGLPKFDD